VCDRNVAPAIVVLIQGEVVMIVVEMSGLSLPWVYFRLARTAMGPSTTLGTDV